jgi:hypothetical protein
MRLGLSACAAFVLIGCHTSDDVELAASKAAIDVDAFELPPSSALSRALIVHDYDRLDPDDLVPRGLLEDAIVYYDLNAALIPQHDYVVVVDLSRYSGEDRFWLVDLATGAVEPHKVAHGDGSDPDNDGYATLFGNVSGSHMSSLGFALTGEIYDGTHPHSMRLDGLSPDGSPNGMANTNIRPRLIVVHEAWYVDDSNDGQQGRSNGCLALDPAIEVGVVDRIHDGSLVYSAIDALHPPVGRAVCGDALCSGDEAGATCAVDCGGTDPGDGLDDAWGDLDDGTGTGDDADGEPGGCSANRGGNGLWLALALLGLSRRRR